MNGQILTSDSLLYSTEEVHWIEVYSNHLEVVMIE